MTNCQPFRIVTTCELQKIARRSEEANLSRLPNNSLWEHIDQNGKHVLDPIPPHGEEHRFIRTFAMCKMEDTVEPAQLFIDVTVEDWQQLPGV